MINVAASWLTEHREQYRAWAASDGGRALLARATLTAPPALRPELTAVDERRLLAELDASAGREARMRSEAAALRQRLADVEREAEQEVAALRRQLSDVELWRRRELDSVRALAARRAAAAGRTAATLRRQLARLSAAERRHMGAARARAARRAAAERHDAAILRRRLAAERLCRRRERGAARAAVLAAEQAARDSLPAWLPSELEGVIRDPGSSRRARRVAQRLLRAV